MYLIQLYYFLGAHCYSFEQSGVGTAKGLLRSLCRLRIHKEVAMSRLTRLSLAGLGLLCVSAPLALAQQYPQTEAVPLPPPGPPPGAATIPAPPAPVPSESIPPVPGAPMPPEYAPAAAPPVQDSGIVPLQTAGETTFINGGIGSEEAAYMRSNAPKFSLRMEFSERRDGEFVRDVALNISDPKGRTVFSLPKAGPLTDIMLPPGSYKVSASYEGETKIQDVSVGGPGRQGKDIAFSWKSSESQ